MPTPVQIRDDAALASAPTSPRTTRPTEQQPSGHQAVARELLSIGDVVAELAERAHSPEDRALAVSLIPRLAGVIHEVRRTAAQQLVAESDHETLRHDLEQTNSRLIDLIATIGHDLRTPLAVVLGYLEVLGDDSRGPDGRRHALLRAGAACTQIRSLLGDVLATAVAQDAVRAVRPRLLDLDTCVPTLLMAVPDGDRVELDIAPGSLVRFDPSHLTQVLANLIGNAFRHGAEPVRVSVVDRGGCTEIRVADDGPGPTPHALAHLFERCAPGPADGSRPDGSTGLGLYLAERLTRANGARLRHEPRTRERPHRFVIEAPA